jgi:predicted esterase
VNPPFRYVKPRPVAPRPFSTLLSIFLLFGGLAAPAVQAATDTRSAGEVYERTVPIIGSAEDEMTIFVKLPPGVKRGADVTGVFAFCTWASNPETIRSVLNEKDADKDGYSIGKRIMAYAAKNNLAVVSWTTFSSKKVFDKSRSFDELSRREVAQFDTAFTRVARTWRRGIDELIKDYQLPKEKWLLYGMSRGGQWAHRIALREPDLFAAVHVHINSSYDQPTPEGAKTQWLVTTGELEAGYPGAKRFYAASRELKYEIILHAQPKLGHENHPDIDRLSTVFFDHVIARLRATAAGKEPPIEDRFVGNYFTHEYVPWVKGAQVSEKFRVILPSRPIAEAWGVAAEE